MKNINLGADMKKAIKAGILTTIGFTALSLSGCNTNNDPATTKSQYQNNSTGTQINLSGSIPFDVKKLKSSSSSESIDDITGYISNQFWITTLDLNKDQLLNVIKKFNQLKVVAYRESMGGFLIEIDESDMVAKQQISDIKNENGILSVYNNTFVGKNVKRAYFQPDDGSRFDNSGDNWYLEYLNMPNVWDMTIGNQDVEIGIMDGGFFIDHPEIISRISKTYATKTDDHGTAVASVIAGISNNKTGVSGINWLSKITTSNYNDENQDSVFSYERMLQNNTKIRIVNNSWGHTACQKEEKFFSTVINCPTIEESIAHTRPYVRIAKKYQNVLHVWAAGNDGSKAETQNGSLHLNDDKTLNKQDNIIIVGALLKSLELAAYSDFGDTIDIAAPTEFKAAKNMNDQYYIDPSSQYGTNWSGGFNGTSAAAPVVTGVASLIFSVNPNLTPKEVKKIIIDSADTFVESISAYDKNKNLISKPLTRKIPILNAEAAVKMAFATKCGDLTPLSEFSRHEPFIAKTGESLQFSTIATPKSSFPHMGYRWTISDISGIASTTVSPFETFKFDKAGEKTISVSPVLADGTVCPAISASITVNQAPAIDDCGTLSSITILGQHEPFKAVTGQALKVSTTPMPKNGFPYSGYRWGTSDSVSFVTTDTPNNTLTPDKAGDITVSVSPILANGTVCPATSTKVAVALQPYVTDFSPKEAIINQVTTFTITGGGLSNSINYTIDGCVDMTPKTTTSTSLKFSCKPTVLGAKNITLRDSSLPTPEVYKNTVTVRELSGLEMQVKILNEITSSGTINDCDIRLTDSYLRDSCHDSFILSEARRLASESICQQSRASFRINECISSVRFDLAYSSPAAPTVPGVAPAESCYVLPDVLMRVSCIDTRESDAISLARSRNLVTQDFCSLLTRDGLKRYCIGLLKP